MTKINQKFGKGFGLLEVMLSAAIIIIILGSLVLVAHASMNNNEYMQMRAQATFLAQEEIETVRQIRDTNWIDGNNTTTWNNLDLNASGTAIAPGCYKTIVNTTNTYRYSLSNIISGAADLGTCQGYVTSTTLRNSKTETVTVSTGNTFYRTVHIDKNLTQNYSNLMSGVSPNENAIKVTATVGFDFNGKQRSVSVSEIITNWRPIF